MHLGTGVGIQELYFTVDDQIKNTPFQFWAGFRYNISNNIESADYFNFNSLTGPTIGLKVINTQLAIIADFPFQNQKGQYSTNFDPLRKRIIVAIQHKIRANQKHHFDLLSELHTTGWKYLDDT